MIDEFVKRGMETLNSIDCIIQRAIKSSLNKTREVFEEIELLIKSKTLLVLLLLLYVPPLVGAASSRVLCKIGLYEDRSSAKTRVFMRFLV